MKILKKEERDGAILTEKFFAFNNADGQLQREANADIRWGKPRLRVKFMHRGLRKGRSAEGFLRQLPGGYPQWGDCLFDFDVASRDYDWLVVYHDLPPADGLITEERLSCPREKTLLITGEPSTITVFGRDYLRQFGHILTFQEPWAIPHPRPIFHHPGLLWYYGLPFQNGAFRSWDDLARAEIPEKKGLISTVCSQRRGSLTLHSRRVDFTGQLQKDLPELMVYGHGVMPMNDKAEALDPYRYHIVIENHVFQHHLTEKLPDAFLGYTLPFYHGAPNTIDYFPKDSFIPIDITNYQRAKDIIRSTLANNEYPDRLALIKEARRRVLYEENLFAILARQLTRLDKGLSQGMALKDGGVIRNRRSMRLKNPVAGVRSLAEKLMVKCYHRIRPNRRFFAG